MKKLILGLSVFAMPLLAASTLDKTYELLQKFDGVTLKGKTIKNNERNRDTFLKESTINHVVKTRLGIRFDQLDVIKQTIQPLDENGKEVGKPVILDRTYANTGELKVIDIPTEGAAVPWMFGHLKILQGSFPDDSGKAEDTTGEIYTVEKWSLNDGILVLEARANSFYPWPKKPPEKGYWYVKDQLNLKFSVEENGRLRLDLTQFGHDADPKTGAIVNEAKEGFLVEQFGPEPK